MAARRWMHRHLRQAVLGDGEADVDHAFASGGLADGLGLAVGPAPSPMSAPLDTGFIDLLRSEAVTNIVEAAEGSTSSELAGPLDARVLGRSTPTPPGRTGRRWRTAPPGAEATA